MGRFHFFLLFWALNNLLSTFRKKTFILSTETSTLLTTTMNEEKNYWECERWKTNEKILQIIYILDNKNCCRPKNISQIKQKFRFDSTKWIFVVFTSEKRNKIVPCMVYVFGVCVCCCVFFFIPSVEFEYTKYSAVCTIFKVIHIIGYETIAWQWRLYETNKFFEENFNKLKNIVQEEICYWKLPLSLRINVEWIYKRIACLK